MASRKQEHIAHFLIQECEFSVFNLCYFNEILMLHVMKLIAHVIEIALYGVIFTRCLCQKSPLARTLLI